MENIVLLSRQVMTVTQFVNIKVGWVTEIRVGSAPQWKNDSRRLNPFCASLIFYYIQS